ncbi:hypothetical protein FI667_g4713, partial [Globisporangium splendens]
MRNTQQNENTINNATQNARNKQQTTNNTPLENRQTHTRASLTDPLHKNDTRELRDSATKTTRRRRPAVRLGQVHQTERASDSSVGRNGEQGTPKDARRRAKSRKVARQTDRQTDCTSGGGKSSTRARQHRSTEFREAQARVT